MTNIKENGRKTKKFCMDYLAKNENYVIVLEEN